LSIKSDRWIRRMAESHAMIEPFAPEQVRMANGHRIVSYGTSSYGYDVRCANEFKIFTNINSTIVDPKNFDRGSFVDQTGDVCLIPPNSFALARTGRVFPHPAQRADRVPRKKHLRTLRNNSERNAPGTRVGRSRDARVLEYDAAARQDLCARGRRADAVLRIR
jgi:hypothetical protein